MFNQTGGIRCGICKEPGHNRRTCPKADTKPKQKPKPKTKRKVRVKKKVKTVVKKSIVAEKNAKKPCASNPCPNRDNIIHNFKTMIHVADMKGGKTAIFKKRVYNRIIEVVSSCEVEIDDIEMATELFKQAGFKNPKKSLDKVREILDTGELGEVKRARAKPEWAATMAIRELTKVYAIGPKNAATLYEKYDIKTIPELKTAVEKSSSILNDKQLLGVKYHDDLQQRIPRVEIDKFNKICEKILERMNEGINVPHFEFSINGSYRRGNKTSGDIDLLLKTLPGMRKGDGLKLIVDALKKEGYIVETLALGKKKFMGVVNHYDKENGVHRHLDIIETTPAEWPFARLYFTGSGGFNVKMRKHAMDLGYTMNEYSIKRIEGKSARALTTAEITEVIGKPQFETERDIFDFLKYEYKEPADRRGFTISKMKH